MKLTRWLFEEVEQTEQQRKLGVINDFVEDILNSSRLFVGTVIKQPDDESWILKTNFNNQPGVDLYLTYSYKWSEQINVFEISRNNKKHYKQYSSMKIKPELNTEDGSFQEWLKGYFSELLGMFESMSELQRELPKVYQEVVELLKQYPNKFNLVDYSQEYDPKISIKFSIIDNPNIHHTALIEIELFLSQIDIGTGINFFFQEEEGEEIFASIVLKKGKSVEEQISKEWPWIQSQIEAMFVEDRD